MGHFLTAIIVLNLVWYVFVLLVFYRAKMMAFLGGDQGGDIIVGCNGGCGKGGPLDKVIKNSDERIDREVHAALDG